MGREFELRVFKRKGEEPGLALSERPSKNDDKFSRGDRPVAPTRRKETRIWGLALKVMTESLLSTLKKQGYRSTALTSQRENPFSLEEPAGVRLGLLFFALKPLRKPSRMEEILAGVNRMSDEEAYYWYAKCTNGRNAQRSRKALRILLAGE
jgi:hypothetical protein